jgi:hypothetical protein
VLQCARDTCSEASMVGFRSELSTEEIVYHEEGAVGCCFHGHARARGLRMFIAESRARPYNFGVGQSERCSR